MGAGSQTEISHTKAIATREAPKLPTYQAGLLKATVGMAAENMFLQPKENLQNQKDRHNIMPTTVKVEHLSLLVYLDQRPTKKA